MAYSFDTEIALDSLLKWNINEEPLRIRVQDEAFKQAYLGMVFQPERIVYRMKTGKSYGFYAEYD